MAPPAAAPPRASRLALAFWNGQRCRNRPLSPNLCNCHKPRLLGPGGPDPSGSVQRALRPGPGCAALAPQGAGNHPLPRSRSSFWTMRLIPPCVYTGPRVDEQPFPPEVPPLKRPNPPFRDDEPALYRVRIRGSLSSSFSDWLRDPQVEVVREGDGSIVTTLTGTAADQAALHGLLTSLRDLGVPLLSVERLEKGTGRQARPRGAS